MTPTPEQLEAMWQVAMRLDDRSMVDIVERALDGDAFYAQLAGATIVDAYASALYTQATSG